MNDRLSKLSPQIIGLDLSGFIKDRAIQDNTLIIKSKEVTLSLKLYISIAYDRAKWIFLIRTLKHGFSEKFIYMIYRSLSNNLSKKSDYFKSSLSRSLFVIFMDVLSRRINHAIMYGLVKSYHVPGSMTHVRVRWRYASFPQWKQEIIIVSQENY